jgi:two-component system sensor histidine kinase/response regulator
VNEPAPSPVSLLLVEDTRLNMALLITVLEPLGHSLVCASSGEEALALAATEDFAAILMDVQLPGIDGYETTRRLRAQPRSAQVPIVFMSAIYDRAEEIQRGMDAGAIDFIPKPFEPALLRAKIRAFVELYLRGERIKQQSEIIRAKDHAATEAKTLAALAKEREHTKDLFIGVLTHDLRNPLSSIVMASRLLMEAEDIPAHHLRTIARIASSGARMGKLIDDIGDFAQGHLGGGIPVNPEAGDLGDISHSTVSELELVFPGRTIAVQCSGNCGGNWDKGRVAQVISNLVSNALRNSKEAVSVHLDGSGDHVALTVHNTGEPIPVLDLPRLFEPFHRGIKHGGGLGLGLFIVKEIVKAHGATISVSSTQTDGTRFLVLWPRDTKAA